MIISMKSIHHSQCKALWHGHVSIQTTDEWTQAWRLPFEQIALFPPEDLRLRAAMPGGVRLAFYSDTSSISGSIVSVPGNQKLDVCCDDVVCGTFDLDDRNEFHFAGLPEGNKLIELWLPQRGDFRLRELRIEDEASLSPYTDPRLQWTTYGSSITHCGEAQSPAYTWPAIVARERNVNLTCLGYGGQCHLDSMVARMIRDRPADYISLCLGINMHGGTVGPRAFLPAIIGFVQIIREKHPTTPILLISPIISPPREVETSGTVWTLPLMREQVQLAWQTLRECGDENIYYLDGLELFGPELVHLLPDDLHPNAEGYKQMGRNFLDKAGPVLFGK